MMNSLRPGFAARLFDRLTLLATSVALVGCREPIESARRFSIVLTLADTTSVAAAVQGPFLSVAESVHVDVRTADGDPLASGGQQLMGYATSVTIPLDVRPGSAAFSARVISENGTVLYSGEATAEVTADGFSVTIPIRPVTPVLVAMPDTTRTSIVTSSQFTILNSGLDSLSWNLQSTDTAFTRCAAQCLMTPSSGRIAAQGTANIAIRVPANFPSRLFAFTLRSPQGSVVPLWRYSASPITGVTVDPTPTIVQSDGGAQLSASVQVTGTAATTVTWSSSNSNIVSVGPGGSISGNVPGTATITATSTVDTSKKGTATVRVPDSAPFTWSLTSPSSPTIVSRDSPGVPNTVSLVAQATTSITTLVSPFPTGVEFWAKPLGTGPWRRLGSVQTFTITQTPTARIYVYTLTWNPDATTAPFTTSTQVSILATGIASNGSTYGTPTNANVTVIP